MWNLQSGQRRKAFLVPDSNGQPASITGLVSDALNKQLIVSTRSGHLHVRTPHQYLSALTDPQVQFFDFHSSQLLATLQAPGLPAITSLLLNRNNNLSAFATSDWSVRILDIETRRIVRDLSGIKGEIVDMVSCERLLHAALC